MRTDLPSLAGGRRWGRPLLGELALAAGEFPVPVIALSAILITLLATLYPSWKASRVRPAEALSYE